ncbi:MAG: Gfo/Idh/MocA family oxidoreductase [Alphaproteobacteria bacterium]|nr:Gfo/Idh/MocA family oxidoreductase [Alphaproteobacteria bacterium]
MIPSLGLGRRLRLGMVGGGATSLIGDSHRVASRMDDRYALVAGAFDIDPAQGRSFAADVGVAPDRAYDTYQAMLEGEAKRDDRCDLVAICTPNSTHYPIARAFVEAGFSVVCEKPLTTSVADAVALVNAVKERGVLFAVMYGYTGFPLVREARAMVAAGELGTIRVVHTEFAHGGYAAATATGDAPPTWRLDPAIQGPSFALGDIGTHALFLASYITGQQASEVAADLHSFVPGRALEDNAHVMLRFDSGARGTLWASGVAAGVIHGHRIRVFGEKAGLEWHQSRPNELLLLPRTGRPTVIERDTRGLSPLSLHRQRVGAGHANGYFESWANIYSDIADVLAARLMGRAPEPLALHFPTVLDGARGVKFIDAAMASAARNGAWVSCAW